MAGTFINNFPLLANSLFLIFSIIIGFFAIISILAVFSKDQDSKVQVIIFAFLLNLLFFGLVISGAVIDSLDVIMFEIMNDNQPTTISPGGIKINS